MINISVRGGSEVYERFKRFHNENPRAITRAMNKASKVAQTASLLNTRQAWNLKARDLKNKTTLKPASVNNAMVLFKMHSTPVSLFEFKAKEYTKGVSYKIQKKRKKLQGNYFLAGTANSRTGDPYVFMRKSKDRDDIMPMFSITPSFMFSTEKSDEVFVKTFFEGKGASRGFRKTYLDQLKNLLEK